MCGIAGIASQKRGDLQHQVGSMINALQHRGPDDSGLWSDHLCALGHRRLAIIDLSQSGRQPLTNEDGTIWITFNGEIYNFEALRRELESSGHRFRTRTDTEVIVHAYEQWGTKCIEHLHGMFAFGIWDQGRRQLFLGRDRVGKKPLFYTKVGHRLFFASELQGLLAVPDIPREVDLFAIDAYLSWGYVPPPYTGFRGILKLPPAHWLTLDLSTETGELRLEKYWSLEYGPKLRISEVEAAVVLREKLREAIRLRMISDVPIGAFLSGGIDSTLVVGLMAELSDRPVKTFSVGFQEAAYNELGHARRVAQMWGTDHHELIVRPDATEVLSTLVRHFGEPYADSSAVPMFYVSRLARSRVTVALTGDGGDESFAGYERYLGNRMAEWVQRIPGGRWCAYLLSRTLPDSLDQKDRLRNAKRFLQVAPQSMAERYSHWIGYFNEATKYRLYSDEMRAIMGDLGDERGGHRWIESLFDRTEALDPAEAAMAVDVQSYLPYDLLVKLDITSMIHGLEARSPFLDHGVMEFAARLPVSLKLRGKESKRLLKRAFPDLLPAENTCRRKMGFGMPVGEWFRGPLQGLLQDTLLSCYALNRGYFQPAVIRQLIEEHGQRKADHGTQLWTLLMLELWHREFVDQ